MIQKIVGEQPFQVLATNFSISPSEQDYTLQISADGVNFSDLFTVSAGQTKMVTSVANGSYYRCRNNQSELTINWRTQCNDGQGGGGGGVGPQGPAGPQGPQGPAGAGDSGQVQTQIDQSISAFSQELQEGQPIVGMAAQLYSPDGVTSNGHFAYRTTAGDADVATGDAELRKLEGNSDYSDVQTSYDASAVLMRNGEPVEGFTCDIELGDVSQWVSVVKNTNITSTYPNTVKARMSISTTNTSYVFNIHSNVGDVGAIVQKTSNGWTASSYTTATSDPLVFEIKIGGATRGTITVDSNQTYVTAELEEYYIVSISSYQNDVTYEILTGGIPNDIPYGESTYTYGLDSWSPELPLAISNMQISGEPYVPQNGDEIAITKSTSVSGSTIYPAPSEFVALGLNSFDYACEGILTTSESDCKVYYDPTDDSGKWGGGTGFTGYSTYFVKAVTGLADGYVIHSPNGYLEFGVGLANADNYDDADFNYTSMVEVSANTTYVVYPTTAMPYVVFAVADGNETDICVHPRWSGKEDNGFEEYSESVVDLSGLAEYPLYSVGDYRNVIDLKNGVFTEYVTAEPFDADTLNDYLENGYTLGVDIAYDENYIYTASDEPTTTSISADYAYKDNDFSVEYFIENGEIMLQPVYAETFYITNLVDKLRRMQADFIHLDSLETEGNDNITYEYNDKLFVWKSSAKWGEWIGEIGTEAEGNENGIWLAYDYLPQSIHHQKFGDLCYTSNYGTTLYAFFDLSNASSPKLVIYNSISPDFSTNPNYTVSKGETLSLPNNAVGIGTEKIYFGEKFIRFFDSKYNTIKNPISTALTEGFELIAPERVYEFNSNFIDGVPKWDKNGRIVGKKYNVTTRTTYFNTTGYTNSTGFFTNGTNGGPDRLFVPTQSGTQGQILQSNGNAEPTWIDWIKVVKITSAAYDALVLAGQTDPNTLYAIDDNA